MVSLRCRQLPALMKSPHSAPDSTSARVSDCLMAVLRLLRADAVHSHSVHEFQSMAASPAFCSQLRSLVDQSQTHTAGIGRRWRQSWRSCSRRLGRWWLGLHRRLVQHRTRLANPSCALHSARVNCSGRVLGSTFFKLSTPFGQHARRDLSCPGCQHNPAAALWLLAGSQLLLLPRAAARTAR